MLSVSYESIISAVVEEYKKNPVHLIIEVVFFLFILFLLPQKVYFQKRKLRNRLREQLTPKEMDVLCKEWEPKPLVPEPQATALAGAVTDGHVVEAVRCGKVVIAGKEYVDFGTFNFLGLGGDAAIVAACEDTIRRYGVGTCGPRGFYGTVDVHLDLEAELRKFFRTQSAVLYSYDFATIASVIPAFAKRGDYIVVDDAVSLSVMTGCVLSRAHMQTFEHNNLSRLEAALDKVNKMIPARNRLKDRKYIVIEGLYANVGDIAPLKEIVALARKYRFRIMMDDTYGIGVLGKTGRGTAEHCGLEPSDIDMITGGLGTACASVGGFCIGSEDVCDHQRLSSSGYCFSASLPTHLATAAIKALQRINEQPALVDKVAVNARLAHEELARLRDVAVVRGCSPSPMILVDVPALHTLGKVAADLTLQRIVDDVMQREGVAFSVARYSDPSEAETWKPSLRICVNAVADGNTVKRSIAALGASIRAELKAMKL